MQMLIRPAIIPVPVTVSVSISASVLVLVLRPVSVAVVPFYARLHAYVLILGVT